MSFEAILSWIAEGTDRDGNSAALASRSSWCELVFDRQGDISLD